MDYVGFQVREFVRGICRSELVEPDATSFSRWSIRLSPLIPISYPCSILSFPSSYRCG